MQSRPEKYKRHESYKHTWVNLPCSPPGDATWHHRSSLARRFSILYIWKTHPLGETQHHITYGLTVVPDQEALYFEKLTI